MPVASVSLILLAALAMVFAAGCHGLNQYPSTGDKFGVFSVQDSQFKHSAAPIATLQESDDSNAEIEAEADDAPPVVKYLPEESAADSAQELASDADAVEDEDALDSGSAPHLADSRKKRRP